MTQEEEERGQGEDRAYGNKIRQPLDANLKQMAEAIKSIGTILGVLGFFLALFPGLRLSIISLFSAKYDVGLGAMYGDGFGKFGGDQFYSWVWSQGGLKGAQNIFKVDKSLIANIGGETVPAYDPGTRSAKAFLEPGQCAYVRSLRFSFFKDPRTPLAGVSQEQLAQEASNGDLAAALLRHVPPGFNSPHCSLASTDPVQGCGKIGVWATVTLTACGMPK